MAVKKCVIFAAKKTGGFAPFKGGSKFISSFQKKLNMAGSDFDKLGLWNKAKQGKILHFAPEKQLSKKIAEQQPTEYVKADLRPKADDVVLIDATTIPFADNYFDSLIATHILEHIPDYSRAIAEFYRVLKPGGSAILQTPFSKTLKNNFADENINTDELRLYFYGLEDHLRIFGEHGFYQDLTAAGFELQIEKHQELFAPDIAFKHGVNKEEDLIKVLKP